MAWTEAARRAAAEARKRIIPAARIFGKKNMTDDLPSFKPVKLSNKPNFVDARKLIATQSTLNLRRVRSLRNAKTLSKIEVIKQGSKYIILDGHHRAASILRKMSKGRTWRSGIDVQVIGIAK